METFACAPCRGQEDEEEETMSFQSSADRQKAGELADKLRTHAAVKDASPGFHLTDDDLALCERALREMSHHPIDN
jgi:hypothetical protein